MASFITLIFLVQLSLLVQNGAAAPQEVSHEDIRDAILSLVTIFRDNSDKLERHEFRERQLGEQLKKALAGLDKRHKSQDQSIEKIGALVTRLDDRLKNLENSVREKDEMDRLQAQSSQNAIQGIQQTLDKMMKELGGSSKGSTASYTIQGTDKDYIERMEATLTSRLDQLSSVIEKVEAKLLSNSPSGGPVPDSDALRELLHVTTRAVHELSSLPSRSELQELNNATHETLQEIKEEIIAISDQGVMKLTTKIEESASGVSSGQEEIMKTVTEVQSMGESLYSDVRQSYEKLLKEVKGLSTVEQVMIQTADNVLDTKRRIEYGVHQILLEVGDLVKLQGKSLNGTVNQRFDDIESTILDNQTGALTNLSSKIETEISQVWRQIGIMYQQLTASADALDRLQQQTDAYVNGSVKTMDSMEGKVGMITSRMSEVDDNLNFLLGKLSLVTSEFNQIKSGLASALDNIRNSFLEVQNEIKDVGPGPRPIQEDNQVSPLQVSGK